MNTDKMTREEFDGLMILVGNEAIRRADRGHMDTFIKSLAVVRVWDRFNAIQSAPFVPDWSLKPEEALGFLGKWIIDSGTVALRRGEFYLPAPSTPTDAELSAMWEKLDRDKRVQILRDAGVVV